MKALLVALAVVVLVGLHSVTAHTWIDCFDTNYTKIYDDSASYIYGGSGGNGFCEGYGAGYPGRGDTDIGTEYTFKMLENEVEAGTDVCQTVDADTYTNTDWRTRISVAPGQTVYFAYLPNGHIVKDKKAIGTQHGIYWTGQVGTSLTSTLDMTAENLMDGYTLDFDDGNCGESVDNEGNPGGRAGDGKPCIGTFIVPTGTAAGVYSMVWYWTFWLDNEASYVDQSQARGYFGAAYSTCFEVEVTSGSGSSTAATEAPSTDAPQVTTATPQSTTAAPQSTTASPAVTTAAPASTAPVATTGTPASTTSTPEASSVVSWDQVDAASAAGDADSTAITSAPVSTSATISTTSAPQVTTAAPVVATAAPVATTPAPVVATAAPVATTAPPVATQTEAPVATSAPVQVTDAPATEAPAQTTPAPQATTTAPVAVTAAPITEAPAQTTSAPEAVTDAPTTEAPTTPATTVAAPTATPDTDTISAAGSDESEDSYSSLNSATFSSLNGDDASAGTVHAASLGSSSSANSSPSADTSSSSDSSAAEVGSGSFTTEPEVSFDSASASESSESSSTTTSSPSSASSSTASASTNAETSLALKSPQSQSWLVLLCVFIAAVVV